MKLLFFLSGENLPLAEWEVLQLAKIYGEIKYHYLDKRFLIINYYGKDFYERLAMTHEVGEVLAETESDEVESVFRELEIPKEPCCVRVTGSLELEKKFGEILWKRGAKISVSNPKIVFKVYIGKKFYISKLLYVVNKKQFSSRSPNKRPFFMPSVVLPKFARALVNLSCAKENMLDPMCGTGSIMIEALLMKIDAVGLDLYEKVAKGCKENLKFYGLKGDVFVGDARCMPFKDSSFESIVTDYPYLRSTKTKGDISELYEKSAEEFARILKKDSFAVVVSNMDVENFFKDFKLLAKFHQRVHGSLTRRILLLRLG
ncbi:MAG: methyltransferase domain-containing protein [Archaeoglobaceae archaeon]|nr:methyltransferase domain-containing protein [Archaeoglobaceae archaeon]MCX8151826.1 methyltransferase domain-containing protein [Archaeoglobaceae archaeon]MDW8014342.1 methyltransferase domain-containing protein [Archaeoglobaceae archaeon]